MSHGQWQTMNTQIKLIMDRQQTAPMKSYHLRIVTCDAHLTVRHNGSSLWAHSATT